MRVPRLRSVALVLLGLAALASAALYGVGNAARWLENPDAPAPADAILVLAGSYFRPLHAAELYRRGLAPAVYITVPVQDPAADMLAGLDIRLPTTESVYQRILLVRGVPADRIFRLERVVISTVDEAHEVRRMLAGKASRLLVVTSPYHVRRTRMVFQDALRGTGLAVSVVATPYESIPEHWWRSQTAARDVLLEWAKIAYYLGGGQFRARP